MPELIVTMRNGEKQALNAVSGMSVMEAVRDAGVDDMLALCGGVCNCATCHVYIDPAFASLLPPMSEDENELLDSSSHRDERSRLSCQIRVNDSLAGLRLTIAEED
jgi:ferredoxin, 2Fe-2S